MLFVKRVTNYSEFAVENFYGWLPELHFIRITMELSYIALLIMKFLSFNLITCIRNVLVKPWKLLMALWNKIIYNYFLAVIHFLSDSR